MSDVSKFDKQLDLEEIHSTILDVDQERLVHMRALGIVLRLMEAGSKARDEKELYSLIVKIVAEEIGCENVSLLLYRPDKAILELTAAIGINQLVSGDAKKFDRKFNKGLFFKEGKSIAWEVFDSQQPVFISDSSEIEIPLVENAKQVPRSLACLPVSSKGILNLSSSLKMEFTNGLKRNLIIIAQVISQLIQGLGRGEVLAEGHFHIQNIVESNNRARTSSSEDMPVDYLMVAMENAPQGICLVDSDGRVLHVNDSVCNLLQSDESFLKERGLGRFFMDASVFLDFTKTIRGGAYRKLSQVRLIRPDGTPFLADFFFHPVKSKKGERRGGIIFIHDLSDHLQDSEQRVREEKLRALGSMAAGIAHDFNNLLMAILGNVELLQMELQGTKFEERLKNIESCVTDGAKTIKRIQTFVKGRSGGGHGGKEKAIETANIIEEAVQFTRPLWKDECEKKGVSISVELELDRELTANIPAYELREIIINLIINAVDAMPSGGKIMIRSYKKDEYAVVEVRDTGVGMDDEVLPHIFDPYFSTKESGSSGLGLSIVFGLISNVGGKIDVVSQKGCGSTFILSIPSSEETREEIQVKPAEHHADDGKLKIMVIDDELQIVDLIGLMLGSLGHEVTSCYDPNKAVEEIKKGRYDLVLTDLGMPGVSGWEIAEKIRSISPDTYVVLMTGWGASFNEEDLKEKGIDALLTKPFRLNDILQVMSKLFKTSFQQP